MVFHTFGLPEKPTILLLHALKKVCVALPRADGFDHRAAGRYTGRLPGTDADTALRVKPIHGGLHRLADAARPRVNPSGAGGVVALEIFHAAPPRLRSSP